MTAPKFYKATLSVDRCKERGLNDKASIGTLFDTLGARDWTVAEEVGKQTGYKHYQCHIEFKKGTDWNHLKSVFAGLGDICPAHERVNKYEIKDGNYICKSEQAIMQYANIALFTWQEQVWEDVQQQNDREITVIIDEDGAKGKTTLTKFFEVNHILKACPVLSDKAQDYIGYCFSTPRSGYLFDFPRADDVRKRDGLWTAVERIKDGHLYEPRYHCQEMWIEPPKIVIFTNETDIPFDKLSRDRWRVWCIDGTFGVPSLRRVGCE